MSDDHLTSEEECPDCSGFDRCDFHEGVRRGRQQIRAGDSVNLDKCDFESEFERFEFLSKTLHDHVAVCRQKHGNEDLFHIPFKNREQLEAFLARNDGDTYAMGFYARGYSNGEYVGENT